MIEHNEIEEIIGDMLKGGLIRDDQAKKISNLCKETNAGLLEVMERLRIVEPAKLAQWFAEHERIQFVNLDELVLPETLIKQIPYDLMNKFQFVPISKKGDIITICLADPYELDSVAQVEMLTNCRVQLAIATRDQVKRCIRDLTGKTSFIRRTALTEDTTMAVLQQAAQESAGEFALALMNTLVKKGILSAEDVERSLRSLRSKK